MAFDVMRQILLERIGKLPAQDPPRPQRIRAVSAPDQGIYLDPDPAGPDLFNLSFKPITLVALRCPDCGKPIDEQDRVCPHCGVDLEAPLGEAELQSLAAEHFEKAREIYEQGRDFKGALAECDQALEFTPDSARLHNLRGLILDAQGKTALAVREYREALQLEPGLAEARDNLTDAQSELRKYRA